MDDFLLDRIRAESLRPAKNDPYRRHALQKWTVGLHSF